MYMVKFKVLLIIQLFTYGVRDKFYFIDYINRIEGKYSHINYITNKFYLL